MLPTTRSAVLALALLLCGGQLVAAQHGIDHLVAPPDHACTQCLHQPGQKHALLHGNPAAAVVLPESAYLLPAVPVRNGKLSRPYQPRAPPISLR